MPGPGPGRRACWRRWPPGSSGRPTTRRCPRGCWRSWAAPPAGATASGCWACCGRWTPGPGRCCSPAARGRGRAGTRPRPRRWSSAGPGAGCPCGGGWPPPSAPWPCWPPTPGRGRPATPPATRARSARPPTSPGGCGRCAWRLTRSWPATWSWSARAPVAGWSRPSWPGPASTWSCWRRAATPPSATSPTRRPTPTASCTCTASPWPPTTWPAGSSPGRPWAGARW